MRTEIINIIKSITTKGQPCLDELLKKLDDLYCKTDMNDKDRRFVKRILGIFYPDIHFVSKSKVPPMEHETSIIPVKNPKENTTKITKKECYHIQIGDEDFGDFIVQSEWEGMKKLINGKGYIVIIAVDPVDRIGEILGFSENGIKIVMAHPDIMVEMFKEHNTEVSLEKYIDWVADAHACLSDLFMKYFNVESPRDGTTLVPKIQELETYIKILKDK